MVNNNDTITLPRNVVEQALEAFEAWDARGRLRVMNALRAALEQPQVEQGPFCYVNVNKNGDVTSVIKRKDSWRKTPLYLHPQVVHAITKPIGETQ